MDEYAQFEGIEIEASDNGETFDLAWALRYLEKFGMDIPDDPLAVYWYAGTRASEEFQQAKDEGLPAFQNWDDEQPFITWES
jgi:hypothetical protein